MQDSLSTVYTTTATLPTSLCNGSLARPKLHLDFVAEVSHLTPITWI